MINNALAWGGMPGGCEWIVILITALIFYGIPLVLIVLFVRYVVRSDKERRRLRLEVSKLADELEQVRKQSEAGQKDNSSTESG